MFQSEKPTNYELVYQGLVKRLEGADFSHALTHLGGKQSDQGVEIPFLGKSYIVSPRGVECPTGSIIDFTVRIVLAHYILHAGSGKLTGEWVTYRDFKDGAFFSSTHNHNVEHKLVETFSSRLIDLKSACEAIGGTAPEKDLGGDVSYFFLALPKIPLALIFYDADDDFPASAKLLYDSSASLFLDMECLSVLGYILTGRLTKGLV